MTTIWYGACGVEFCADCLPIYDANNNPIGDEPQTTGEATA